MLFYLVFKSSKNGVLYGLNKEHVNFNAHHETKCSHGVGPLSSHCQGQAAWPRTLAGRWAGGAGTAPG